MSTPIEDAMRDPGDVFEGPGDVLTSDFSRDEQQQILESWEDQLQKRQLATAEGMTAGDDRQIGTLLSAIAEALRTLAS
jgi:hypothetical protein